MIISVLLGFVAAYDWRQFTLWIVFPIDFSFHKLILFCGWVCNWTSACFQLLNFSQCNSSSFPSYLKNYWCPLRKQWAKRKKGKRAHVRNKPWSHFTVDCLSKAVFLTANFRRTCRSWQWGQMAGYMVPLWLHLLRCRPIFYSPSFLPG